MVQAAMLSLCVASCTDLEEDGGGGSIEEPNS